MLAFETASGERVIVTKACNFDLQKKVSEARETYAQTEIDAVRKTFDLPPEARHEVLSRPSTTLNDPKDPSAGYMSIGQLVVKNLLDKYRGMLERAEMAKDDPRAKIVRAFEARSALTNGYSLLPYYEETSGPGTDRNYVGGEADPTYSTMSPEDVSALLDPAKVDAQIAQLLDNGTIQADYEASLNAQVKKFPNRQALLDELYASLISPEYMAALQALRDKGLNQAAEQMTSSDLQQLLVLDPAKAALASQALSVNSRAADLQSLIENPALIDNVTFDQAVYDNLSIVIQSLRSASSLARHGSQTAADIITFLNETKGNKKLVTALSQTLRQMMIDVKAKGTVPGVNIEVTPEKLAAAMDKTYLPMDLRREVTGFIGKAQKFGVWGSIGGGAALAAFGYKLHNGAWGSNSTALDRFGAARDIISFLSVVGHVAKTGAGIADSLLSMVGMNPDGERAWKALGLDHTLPEVWGKKSFLPDEKSFIELWQSYNKSAPKPPAAPDIAPVVDRATALLADSWEEKAPFSSNLGARVSVSMLKVLGTVSDLGGIADIVLGALGLQKSIAQGDAGGIVANSLAVGGGVGLTGAGVIGTAGLIATVPPVIAVASGPLFLVGAALTMGAFIVAAVLDATKHHNQLQDASDDQTQWFRDLANDGLAAPDWFDKLEYLRYAWSIYGNDDTHHGENYFEFQKPEWEHFRVAPGKDGSSLHRLDEGLHVRTELTLPDQRQAKKEEQARESVVTS